MRLDYEITIVVQGSLKVIPAGCVLLNRDGTIHLVCKRTACTTETAVRSVMQEVEAAGGVIDYLTIL
jgi:hypothetical protein